MKSIFYTLLALPLILISCQKSPIASFSIDSGETVVGQPVFFTNTSHNSDRFEWDFGDGYTSNESDPVHTFTSTGSFEVIMTALAKGGHSDETRMTLNIMIPTLLEVEVREYYSEDLIPGASIILYPTIADWDAETNSVVEGIADADGVAVFSNLDPFVYYADVWEATHDNYQLRSEDVGNITIPQIVPNKINRYIAWVDVAVHTKGTARGSREFIIKKLERKASDKRQPAGDAGTENWQELYNRRVNK
jgi:hypothetical protein